MAYDFKELQTELEGTQAWLQKELSHISSGRANPAMLDSIMVEAYGSLQPIKNLTSINNEDPRTLRIVSWDKGQIKDIEKALRESKLPLSISVDGEGLRATIPQLTSENKVSITKMVKEKLEEARVRIRSARQKTDKDIEARGKEGDFGEDEKHAHKEKAQKMIDDANKQAETISLKKETDIMAV